MIMVILIIKVYIPLIIKKKILSCVLQKNKYNNLEMNYVYDQEFNLWAIKNAFGEHFY